jgi:hypothetical protein
MKGYIKETHQGGVYSRLYLDSTVRKKKQDNIEKQGTSAVETIARVRKKIENTLLLKHAKSQAKLNSLRYKQQVKETEGITGVPRINRISKEIVQIKEGGQESVSLYTTKLLNTSRSSSTLRMTPKQSFLSLLDLKQANDSGKSKKVIRLVEEVKHEEERLPPEYAAVQIMKGKYQAAEEDIQNIRSQVFEKCKMSEPVVVKKSLLNMDVLERNMFWLESKKSRISQQKEEKAVQETLGCTFTPRLVGRLDTSVDSRKKQMSIVNSYSERHLNLNSSHSKMTCKAETPVIRGVEKKAAGYKAISPHERSFSHGGSLKLLQNARPMAPYSHL